MPQAASDVENSRLTVIDDLSELLELRDLYRRDWPQNCIGYYCLDNFIRWLQIDPKIKHLKIYTLNNDWRSEGLYLIVDRYQLFVRSLNKTNNDLLSLAISKLDWKSGYKVTSFLACHYSAVENVIKSKNLVLEYVSHTVMYYMPQIKAMELEIVCPPGFYLRQLRVQTDAKIVDDHWPKKHHGSFVKISRLITLNINVGVYKTENDELVAWCLRAQSGFLGALQVKDKFKRLGLGSLVTRVIARKIAESGDDVVALVNPDNKPSRGIFDKLGFKVIDACRVLRTLPTKDGSEWPEGE